MKFGTSLLTSAGLGTRGISLKLGTHALPVFTGRVHGP